MEVVGIEAGEAQTMNGDVDPGETFTVEKTVSEVSAEDYDALIVPGGTVGADNVRASEEAIAFVRGFFEGAKPVGVICHGPWALVEADVLGGRALPTSYPTLESRHPQRGGRVGGPQGGRNRPGLGHQPQPRRPAGVLRQDRRGDRRGQAQGAGPQRVRPCNAFAGSEVSPPARPPTMKEQERTGR